MWAIGMGLALASVMMLLSSSCETAIPHVIWNCLYAPALGLAWVWEKLGLGPHSEAAFAMVYMFEVLQWFFIGAFVGLWWSCRLERKRSARQNSLRADQPGCASEA